MTLHLAGIGLGYALFLTTKAGLALNGAAPETSSLPPATRIGVVAVQNRSGQEVAYSDMDAILARLLRSEGLAPVALVFQPPADVEYAARKAECGYILYTDIVAVRKAARSQFTKALRMLSGVARPRAMAYAGEEAIVAEVEFRLYVVDEVLPRISTTVTATSSKRERKPDATVYRPAKTALAGALEREVRMIRDAVRR